MLAKQKIRLDYCDCLPDWNMNPHFCYSGGLSFQSDNFKPISNYSQNEYIQTEVPVFPVGFMIGCIWEFIGNSL